MSRLLSARSDSASIDAQGPRYKRPRAPLNDAQQNVRWLHETHPRMWRGIKEELDHFAQQCEARKITSAPDLARAIQEIRNASGRATEAMIGFTKALETAKERGVCRVKKFCGPVAAFMARMTMYLPSLFQDGLPVLAQGETNEVFLTRRQCVALLSAAVFAVLPDTKAQGDIGDFDIGGLFDTEEEKALCLITYFYEVGMADDEFLDQIVSFGRRKEEQFAHPFWMALDKPLLKARIKEGPIEEQHGCLQASFSNDYLGGDFFHGCVAQEEIRFAICPECLVGRFISERCLSSEAIIITGAMQYSCYSGTGSSFKFEGPCKEAPWAPPDFLERHGPQVVAMDPLFFPGKDQYNPPQVLRELCKCYVACLGDPLEDRGNRSKTQSRPAFATGNWGCGAFGGDPQLKVLIQWLAASASDRELRFCPFDDPRLEELPEVVKAVWDSGAKCSDLYKLLYGHKKKRGVFNGLQKNIEALKRAGVLVPRPPEQDSGDEEGGGDGEYGDESAEN